MMFLTRNALFAILALAFVLSALPPGTGRAQGGPYQSYLPIISRPIVPGPSYAYFPFYIDRSGAKEPALPQTLGVDYASGQPITQGRHLSRLDDLGTTWIRFHLRVSWRSLQPEEGGPILWEQLAMLESELRALRQHGVRPVLVVLDNPRWATINVPYPTSCGAIRADKFQAFADFMAALAARYGTDEFNVHDWELGNEPDVDPTLLGLDGFLGCWGDRNDIFYGGRHYGEMLKVVTPAIKAVDPSARTWIGGLLLWSPNTSGNDIGKPEMFFKGILEAGAAPYFDVLAYHAYPMYLTDDIIDYDVTIPWIEWGGVVVGKARYLRGIMAEYEVDKTLYANEVALMCPPYSPVCNPPNAPFYPAQANYLVRTFIRARNEGVDGLSWFSINSSGWRYTGLVDEHGVPKAVYHAYRAMIDQMQGALFAGPVDHYGEGVEAYSFYRAQEVVHVLWRRNNDQSVISIPEHQFVQAFDINGEVLPLAAVAGQYKVTLTFEPVYLVLRPTP